jgi:hypothetical protein
MEAIILDTINQTNKIEQWFENFIDTITAHGYMMTTGTASEEIKGIYESIIANDELRLAHISRVAAQATLAKKTTISYLKNLSNIFPSKLAFQNNDSEILVWAEIEDDDWDMEKHLIKAMGKTNAQTHQYGMDVIMTIVEKSDNLSIPNHYKLFKP